MGSTHLKNISQNRKSSKIEWTSHIWNHHLDPISMVAYPKESPSRQVSRIRQQTFSAVFCHTSPTLALCCTSRWRPWSSASYNFHKPKVAVQMESRWGYGCFRKWGYPQIIHFNRVFHYKPSILGYCIPIFLKHPYIESYLWVDDHPLPQLHESFDLSRYVGIRTPPWLLVGGSSRPQFKACSANGIISPNFWVGFRV